MPEVGEMRTVDYGRNVEAWDGEKWKPYSPDHDLMVKDILDDLSEGDRTQEVIDMKLLEIKENYQHPVIVATHSIFQSIPLQPGQMFPVEDIKDAFQMQSQKAWAQSQQAGLRGGGNLLNSLFGGGL